ncbi:MAG: hypothetical protein AAF806_19285 [Bacteroidota bacterium]
MKTYKFILMPFLPHVNGEDIEKLFENDIRDWMLKKLKARGSPYASAKAYAATIRLFYRELFRRTTTESTIVNCAVFSNSTKTMYSNNGGGIVEFHHK